MRSNETIRREGFAIAPLLITIAWISLAVGFCCALLIGIDLARNPQKMWIMNFVWPVTALYAGPLAVLAYFRIGRLSAKKNVQQAKQAGKKNPGKQKPFWQIAGVGATHCGAGCSLGDLAAEWIAFGFPLVLAWLGYGSLWQEKVFATWTLDYIFALSFGIAFQYFSIVPMRNLSPGKGLVTAFKADFLSLSAWQVGMYGWMAIAIFVIFSPQTLHTTSPVFWFMMQIAMLCGFATAYPVNGWLIRKGIKEKM